jgi:non-canonical poly(A) RNA polymerase PAPD5/7
MVLKHLLKVYSLNDPYTGGMSSYALILMIVAFMQFYETFLAEKTTQILNFFDPKPSPGLIAKIMTEFLHTYIKFDLLKIVIQPKHPHLMNEYTYHMSSIFQKGSEDGGLIIMDPLNSENNVGKSSFNIADIKSCFESAYNQILMSINENQHADYEKWSSETLKID